MRWAFARLWVGNVACTGAMALLPIALGIAAVEASVDVVTLGVALAARTVGFVVATPLAGSVADRYPRGVVMACAGVVAALGTVLLAAGLSKGGWLPFAAAAFAGVGQGLYRPAFQAAIADVVPVERRQAANAVATIGSRVVAVVAPGLAAGATALVGARVALASSGLMWLFAALGPYVHRGQRRRSAPWRAGLGEAMRHRWFVAGLGAMAVQLATGYAATQVILPVVSQRTSAGVALLAGALTAYTLGALIGAAVMLRWRPRASGRWALAGMSAYALAPLALVFPSFNGVVGAYAVAGMGAAVFNITWFTATQREVPAHLLARVSSIDFLLSYGLAPLGLAAIAPLAQAAGQQAVLGASAVVCLVAPIAAMLVPESYGFSRTSSQRVAHGAGPQFVTGSRDGDCEQPRT